MEDKILALENMMVFTHFVQWDKTFNYMAFFKLLIGD